MKNATPPLNVVSAEGCTLTLADGRKLIDGIASWWTACHGYRHPHIVTSVTAQINKLPHIMLGGLVHEQAERLAARLVRLLPGDLDHVFFSDSGSVAVEVALKMAVQYWLNRGEKNRRKFISFKNGYHGDTFAAMSVSDPVEGMHALFGDVLSRQHVLPLPDTRENQEIFLKTLLQHRNEIAAVIIEPLAQGAGGMRFHAPEILSFLRRSCDKNNVLLVFDEIMTGFRRLGPLFACEEADVMPDIITLGKALSAGTLPLAVTVAHRHVFEAFLSDDPKAAFMHGPTFMGNALACAAANASLDIFEREPRQIQVQQIEKTLRAGLEPCRKLQNVIDVRAKGAIGVIEFNQPTERDWLQSLLIDAGVWARPFGNILYLAPPFTVSNAELSTLIEAINKAAHAFAKRHS